MMDIYTALLYWGVLIGVALVSFFSILFAMLYNKAQIKMYHRWLTETSQHDKYEKWRAGQRILLKIGTQDAFKK